MRKVISIIKISSQIQETLCRVTKVTQGISAPFNLLSVRCSFPWYKMLLQDQSDGVEDILQDKIPAAEATQTNCPPQNSSVQHSKGVHRAGRTNLEGQGAAGLVFFFFCRWVGFLLFFFFRVCLILKKILCATLRKDPRRLFQKEWLTSNSIPKEAREMDCLISF